MELTSPEQKCRGRTSQGLSHKRRAFREPFSRIPSFAAPLLRIQISGVPIFVSLGVPRPSFVGVTSRTLSCTE